jgi:hypothetical protein
MSNPTVKVEVKGDMLVISLPIDKNPQLSASQKNRTIASTRGNMATGIDFNGKEITIGVNAYIKA